MCARHCIFASILVYDSNVPRSEFEVRMSPHEKRGPEHTVCHIAFSSVNTIIHIIVPLLQIVSVCEAAASRHIFFLLLFSLSSSGASCPFPFAFEIK